LKYLHLDEKKYPKIEQKLRVNVHMSVRPGLGPAFRSPLFPCRFATFYPICITRSCCQCREIPQAGLGTKIKQACQTGPLSAPFHAQNEKSKGR